MEDAHFKLKIKFIMLIARALHRYGASADRIETALYVISDKLKIKADYFSLPTSITASFRTQSEDEFTRMVRLDPGKINLEKLYFADLTVDDVIDEKITLKEGIDRLKFVMDKPALHPEWPSIFSIALLASNVTLILNGNAYDSLLSGFLGLLVGLITSKIKIERIDTIAEAFTAFFVSFLTFFFSSYIPEVNSHIVILATLIYFVPGLSLTMAIGEISSQNLTSGTARLMGAIVILLKIAFGIYLGSLVAKNFFTPGPGLDHIIGLKYKFISLIFISFSFVISFQARWQDTFWIIFAGVSTFSVNLFFSEAFSPTAGALIAGSYIGAGSNIYARFKSRPSMIVSLPAIILLVPGSVGLKGIEFLFGQNTLNGINTLFNTFVIGLALVAGTYFGNIIVKPKRSL